MRWLRYYWLHITVPLVLWLVIWQSGIITPAPEGFELPKPDTTDETPIQITDADLEFTSDAGLFYGVDPSPKFATRIEHVMAHTQPDPSKKKHSVFIEKDERAVLQLLDEAWNIRGPPERQGGKDGRDVYTIDMQRKVGESGQTYIRIIVEADSSNVVTAYPVDGL